MTKPQLVVDVLHLPDVEDTGSVEMITMVGICDKVLASGGKSAVSALTECSPEELQIAFNVHMKLLLMASENRKESGLKTSAGCIADILAATMIHATAEDILK